jgi:hypothetical protein
MSYTEKVDLPSYRLGDTYMALGGFGPVLVTPAGEEVAVTPDDPLLRVRMQFKLRHRGRNLVYTLDSDPSTNPDKLITISGPNLWIVEIGVIKDFLPQAGNWRWDAEFYSNYFGAVGGSLTFYHGTLTVKNDITH